MLHRLLIIVLLLLLDRPNGTAPEAVEEDWLANNWTSPGFKSYFTRRDAKMLKEMAGGVTLEPPPRDKAYRMAGQRFELLRFAQQCKNAHDARMKKLKQHQN